jgi:hypothetical protein
MEQRMSLEFARALQTQDPHKLYERTASEFLAKQAALGVSVNFELRDGFVIANTDYGQYWFAYDPDGQNLSVYQVL